MFGWFHCSAVHSLSLSMDMPIWSNLLVPPFVLPQFHHFKAELVLGTVRTGHLRYHSRCRACTDALCMSDEVWLHRLGAGDVMSHLPSMSATGWLPYFFVGSLCLCGSLAMKLLGGLDLNLACSLHLAKAWVLHSWLHQVLGQLQLVPSGCCACADIFPVFDIIFAVVCRDVYIQIDGSTNFFEHWHGGQRGLSIWCMQLVELSFSQDFFRRCRELLSMWQVLWLSSGIRICWILWFGARIHCVRHADDRGRQACKISLHYWWLLFRQGLSSLQFASETLVFAVGNPWEHVRPPLQSIWTSWTSFSFFCSSLVNAAGKY